MKQFPRVLSVLIGVIIFWQPLHSQFENRPTPPVDTSKLSWQGTIKKGQRNGSWQAHNAANNILIKAEFKKGKPNGIWSEYYTSGELRETGTFKNGFREGTWYAYYRDKDSMIVTNYEHGVRNGAFRDFDGQGRIINQGNYVNGKKEGKWDWYVHFDAKGQFERTTSNYLRDTLNGISERFRNEKLTEITNYRNGKLNGLHEMYWPDGKLCKREYYIDNVRDGIYLGYWQGTNAQPSDSGRFVNGKKVGYWVYYDLGWLKRREWYKAPLADTIFKSDPKSSNGKTISRIRILERYDSILEYDYNGFLTRKTVYRDTTGEVWYKGGVAEITTFHHGSTVVETKITKIMGDEIGLYYKFHTNGAMSQKLTYQTNTINGPCDWFYEDGKPRAHDDVHFNQLSEMMKLYDRNGKVISRSSPVFNIMRDSLYVLTFRLMKPMPIVEVQEDDEPEMIQPSVVESVEEEPADEVLSFAEQMPQFPGGDDSLQSYLKKNMRYPQMEKEQGKEGTVYIYFEVAKDGTIGNVKTQKGVPGAPGFSKEAERLFKSMPPWNPGKMNGRAVNVGMTKPVRFVLAK